MLSEISTLHVVTVASGLLGLQFLLGIYVISSTRFALRECNRLNREMFGLVRKLEGLTSSRREQMLKAYNQMLDTLSARLPPTIAAETSNIIFETESKILSRLAELEPNLKQDENGKRKLNDLIKSMESLEKTIVTLAADTVQRVMVESRRDLFDDDSYSEKNLAA